MLVNWIEYHLGEEIGVGTRIVSNRNGSKKAALWKYVLILGTLFTPGSLRHATVRPIGSGLPAMPGLSHSLQASRRLGGFPFFHIHGVIDPAEASPTLSFPGSKLHLFRHRTTSSLRPNASLPLVTLPPLKRNNLGLVDREFSKACPFQNPSSARYGGTMPLRIHGGDRRTNYKYFSFQFLGLPRQLNTCRVKRWQSSRWENDHVQTLAN